MKKILLFLSGGLLVLAIQAAWTWYGFARLNLPITWECEAGWKRTVAWDSETLSLTRTYWNCPPTNPPILDN